VQNEPRRSSPPPANVYRSRAIKVWSSEQPARHDAGRLYGHARLGQVGKPVGDSHHSLRRGQSGRARAVVDQLGMLAQLGFAHAPGTERPMVGIPVEGAVEPAAR
jgi:hypothetical protein